MNVRRHAQRRYHRRLVLARNPTLRQMLRSLEGYARARGEARGHEAVWLGMLREHADRLARELTADLMHAGALHVEVSWDLEDDVPIHRLVAPPRTGQLWPPRRPGLPEPLGGQRPPAVPYASYPPEYGTGPRGGRELGTVWLDEAPE